MGGEGADSPLDEDLESRGAGAGTRPGEELGVRVEQAELDGAVLLEEAVEGEREFDTAGTSSDDCDPEGRRLGGGWRSDREGCGESVEQRAKRLDGQNARRRGGDGRECGGRPKGDAGDIEGEGGAVGKEHLAAAGIESLDRGDDEAGSTGGDEPPQIDTGLGGGVQPGDDPGKHPAVGGQAGVVHNRETEARDRATTPHADDMQVRVSRAEQHQLTWWQTRWGMVHGRRGAVTETRGLGMEKCGGRFGSTSDVVGGLGGTGEPEAFDTGGEGLVFFREQGPQVNQHVARGDAGKDAGGAQSQPAGELIGGELLVVQAEDRGGELGHGQRASTDGSRLEFDRHLAGRVVCEVRLPAEGKPVGPLAQGCDGSLEQLQRGEVVPVLIEQVASEGGLQGGEGQFIDAERAGERVAGDAVDEWATAQQDAALGAAEQFVTTSQDQIGTGGETVLEGGFARQPEGGGVHEAATADVVDAVNAPVVGEGDQFGKGGGVAEAGDPIVRRVHPEQGGGGGSAGGVVVTQSGDIGGANFAERGPTDGEDFGEAEGAANLDQLSPGEEHFASTGECREGEDGGGGIVVDDEGGLGPGQLVEECLELMSPGATIAREEIDLKVAAPAGPEQGRTGLVGEGGAAERGVEHDPGGIEHGSETRVRLLVGQFDHARDKPFQPGVAAWGGGLEDDLLAGLGERRAGELGEGLVTEQGTGLGEGRALQQLGHAGELAQGGVGGCGHSQLTSGRARGNLRSSAA